MKKWKTTQRCKGLTSVKQERRAVAVSRSNLWYQNGIPQNLIIVKSLKKKSLQFFVLFVWRCWHLSCQISIESVRKIIICLRNVFMTVKFRFYWAIINWNFIWNIDFNNGIYCDLRNKSACRNTVLGSTPKYIHNSTYIQTRVYKFQCWQFYVILDKILQFLTQIK